MPDTAPSAAAAVPALGEAEQGVPAPVPAQGTAPPSHNTRDPAEHSPEPLGSSRSLEPEERADRAKPGFEC